VSFIVGEELGECGEGGRSSERVESAGFWICAVRFSRFDLSMPWIRISGDYGLGFTIFRSGVPLVRSPLAQYESPSSLTGMCKL